MVLADTNTDPRELSMLYSIGQEKGISKQEMDEFISSTGAALAFPDKLEDKIELLYDLTKVAWADGDFAQQETDLLKKMCLNLGFLEENVDELTDFFQTQVKNGLTFPDLLTLIKQ